MKSELFLFRKFYFGMRVFIGIIFSLILSINAFSQSALKVHLPMGKFYGDAIDSTGFTPIFNVTSFTYQAYATLSENEKVVLFVDAGLGVIGTKQIFENDKYKARVYGLQLGMYFKYNILKPTLTPYIYTGINLDILFANELYLATISGNNTYRTEVGHRVLFPEYVVGVGFTFLQGGLSLDLQDKIGLISVVNGESIKSNLISIGIIVHATIFDL
ncbi:MAG TPA: hypothetical protein PLW31_12350 [Bacteroidales bacterium]|nr:hypothetical protein [Bacteroidales bacterium]HOX78812.1 hypothetical protein [Bacteroidales bacterium]HPI86721.1 hypothetical protein [Bacteroidales bacterium]HPM91411.1 hypothetical protein [Bacteroidales bacterium]